MTIRKYEFNSVSEFVSKAVDILPQETDFASHPYFTPFQGVGCTIVKLLVYNTPPEIDQEGNVITEGVLSSKLHVDISYDSGALEAIAANETWPKPNGIHMFAGWEDWYQNEYNKRNSL